MIEELGIYEEANLYHRNGRDPFSKPSIKFEGLWWVQKIKGSGLEFPVRPDVTLYVERGWRCNTCRTTFFGSEVSDLRHGCTGDPDIRPLIAGWAAGVVAFTALLFYVWS